ncbi:hypothetical protein LINPERHAP2_LOCUS29051 [Linum perenne]
MSGFNAFKAQLPIAWSPRLYIILVRRIPGTRRLHRRTLEALCLTKCNRTVVKRLIVIETEKMYNAHKQNDAKHKVVRPPVVIGHSPATASSSS